MPQTRPNGAVVPVGSDPYAITQDLSDLADSINPVIPVASEAERNALAAYPGMMVVRTDMGGLTQVYADGAWRSNYAGPYRWWNALTTFIIDPTATQASRSIVFPSGLFTQPPLVQATKQSGSGAKFIMYVSDVTTTGCTVGMYTGDGSTTTATIPVALWCVQATPTVAGGNL